MLELKINTIDRTDSVDFGTVGINDVLNNQVNTLTFRVRKYGDRTFVPAISDAVVMKDDTVTVFAGEVSKITESADGAGQLIYDVTCSDYTKQLDRRLIVETYASLTVAEIIAEFMDTYAPDYTYANVVCNTAVSSITFDRVPVSQAIDKLAKMAGCSWYVDYDKDVHFFAVAGELAPFDLTDTSDNYLFDTLQISHDMSQLRNRVFIRGGEVVGASRTEQFDTDATKKIFKLGSKFSELPTVTVNGAAQDVGVDFLDDDTLFDCMWDFNQKTIRFIDVPATGANYLVVSGTPLYPLVVQVEHPVSVAEHGVYEFAKKDTTIKTRGEAVAFAVAELTQYAQEIAEGSFMTYTPGLRSGQLIRITSTQRGIDEQFIIQRISYRMLNRDMGVWAVTLASYRTVGIVEVMTNLLRASTQATIGESSTEVLEKSWFITENVVNTVDIATIAHAVTETETVTTGESNTVQALDYPVEFVYGWFAPTGYKRCFVLNGSPLA